MIAPNIPKGLSYVNCSYQSPNGMIVSNWNKKGSESFQFELKIPAESEATVKLPFHKFRKISLININSQNQIVTTLSSTDFTLKGGTYRIIVLL